MFTKLQKEWQVTIPESIVRELGIGEETAMECFVKDGVIHLHPVSIMGKKIGI